MSADWSFPDQLVLAIIRSLLQLAKENPEFKSDVIQCILTFISDIGKTLNTGQGESAYFQWNIDPNCQSAIQSITHAAPAFHGLYRAIVCTPFSWSLDDWERLATSVASLFGSTATDHFNNLVIDSLESEDFDTPQNEYLQMFMARYLNSNRPLTGYFMICCVVEMQWIVLSQTFSKLSSTSASDIRVESVRGDAEAANRAWADLTRGLLKYDGVIEEAPKQILERTLRGSTQLFSELVSHIERMGDDTSLDTYAWETMAEALVN
jgi:phosphatidylinositol 4-kinase